MTYPVIQRELTVHLNNGNWYLRPLDDQNILGPVDYAWYRYNQYPDSFTFGEGLLAGSSIPGSRRLVFGAWSPQWEGFYVSSMGGAAYTFHGVGVNYVALRGRAASPSVLLLNHKAGEIQVRIEPINVDALWLSNASPDGRPLTGFFAIQQAVWDRYSSEYAPGKVRIFAVGPAAKYTMEGAIASSPVRQGQFTAVVDWAGRGGLGSRLFQYHNIAACVFGGEWEDPDLKNSAEIDAYFMEHFNQRTIQTDISLTEKYRYVPQFETGGTFGVNYKEMDDRLLSYNYTSIYHTPDERLAQHKTFVLDHYLAQFNEETIRTKKFQHCGEPCPVVCKKINDIYKKDYEPYHTLGPQIGVFDQRAAEMINDYADAMGFDGIQVGCTVAWIMELVHDGLIEPQDFGFPAKDELKFDFATENSQFDVVNDSMTNANYAKAVIDALLFDPRAELFRPGMRSAAHELDRTLKINSVDRAIFTAHGESGYMAPNQYWTPGMLSPMPMMGKYFCFYSNEFLPPFMLGKKNVERMTYELFNENSGVCRFHRKWAETITDEILMAHYGLKVDYKAHQFFLAKAIYERENSKDVLWETEKNADLVLSFLEMWQRNGLKNAELDQWVERFHADKSAAAREFWKEIRRGIAQAFVDGPDAIRDQLTPGQLKKINEQKGDTGG